jgi:hypothetical protein
MEKHNLTIYVQPNGELLLVDDAGPHPYFYTLPSWGALLHSYNVEVLEDFNIRVKVDNILPV